jgi:hypothetical protein
MMTWLVALLAQAALGDPAAPAPVVDAPADQAPAASTETPAAPAEATPAPRRRCYRIQDTGSNRYRRVCTTEAQSEEEADNRLREQVRRSTERGGTSNVLAPSGVD